MLSFSYKNYRIFIDFFSSILTYFIKINIGVVLNTSSKLRNIYYYILPLFLGFFRYNLVMSVIKSSGLASFVRSLSSQVSFPIR